MFKLTPPLLFAAVAGIGVSQAAAQTIERVRLTDNDLSCQQIFAEIQQMDTAMQLAGPGVAATPPGPQAVTQGAVPQQQQLPQALPAINSLQGAVLLDPKVQAAIARARAQGMSEAQINATVGLGMQRSGLGAVTGATLAQMHAPAVSAGQAYAQAGGLAGVLGAGMSAQGSSGSNAAGLAGMFGALAGMGAKPAVAAPVAAVPAPVPAPVAGNSLGAQARARKDHLTGFFLAKGCRMSDIQQ